MTARTPELADENERDAGHDGDGGHVEYARTKRTDADIDEIDDAAVQHAIDPVRDAAGDEQRQTEGRPTPPPQPDAIRDEREQKDAGGDDEQRRARRFRQIGAETEK